MPEALPAHVAAIADELGSLPGVVAVVLGGSRATGTHRPDSDWDLGVYYRGGFDPAGVRALGHDGFVSEVGEWGPIVNGGAWLTVAGTPVDVLYRDVDVVERWTQDAVEGRYEVLLQNGYLVGAPTYLVAGELALCRHLAGTLPRPDYPDALATAAPDRWRGRASVALLFASDADPVGRRGLLAQAVLCVAHARMAERREWVLNEKRLVQRAGLGDPGGTVAEVSAALGVAPLRRHAGSDIVRAMAVKLHRCPVMFAKSKGHPCWKVQSALDEAGIEYEVVKEPLFRWNRKDYKQATGVNVLPALEFEDGTYVREESDELVARIKEGRLAI